MNKPLLYHVLLLFFLTGPLSFAATSSTTLYTEVGDAGDVYSPQALDGAYNGFAGSLDGNDVNDAFSFHFAGGDFGAVGQLLPAGEAALALFFELFTPTDPCYPVDPCTPTVIGTANADGFLTISNLAAGDYIMQAALNANYDPPFTIELFGPNTNTPLTVTAPTTVPEPAPLALLVFGYLGWRLRKTDTAQ